MSSACVVQRVLVIDDEERVLTAWRRALRGECAVLTASNAKAAHRIAQRDRPDLAIVDVRLGADSGLDLVRALRRDLPELKIAVVSGWLTLTVALAATQAGADLFFAKSVMPREIVFQARAGTAPPVEIDDTPSLKRVEYEHLQRVLAAANGNVAEAARRLGMHRQSLARKLARPMPRR